MGICRPGLGPQNLVHRERAVLKIFKRNADTASRCAHFASYVFAEPHRTLPRRCGGDKLKKKRLVNDHAVDANATRTRRVISNPKQQHEIEKSELCLAHCTRNDRNHSLSNAAEFGLLMESQNWGWACL